MYTQFAEKWLGQQPKLTAMQQEFLEEALAFYQEFAVSHGADTQARHEAAKAALRVGRIRQALGRYNEAEAAFRQAQGQFEALTKEFPEREAYREGVAEAAVELGDVEGELARLGEAERNFRRAGEIRTTLVDRFPAVSRYRDDLADVHRRLAGLLLRAGRPVEAEEASRRGLVIAEKLVADFPAEASYRVGLARALRSSAAPLPNMRHAEAIALDRRAIGILTGLDEAQAQKAENLLALNSSYANLGYRLVWESRPKEAEAAYQQALRGIEPLADAHPEVIRYQRALAALLSNMGTLSLGEGRTDEAEARSRKALVVRERLANRYPDVPDFISDLGGSLHNLALVLTKQGKLAESRLLLERAIGRQQAALTANPRNPTYRRFYNNHHIVLLELLAGTGDHEAVANTVRVMAAKDFPRDEDSPGLRGARSAFELARVIPMAAKDPGLTPERRAEVVRAYVRQVKQLVEETVRGGTDHYQTLFSLLHLLTTTSVAELRDPERAVTLSRRLSELGPREQLAWKYLGLAEYQRGHWDAAIEAEKKCLEVRGDPGYVFQTVVIGMAHARRGDEAKAREMLAPVKPQLESGDMADTPADLCEEARALLGLVKPPSDASKETPRKKDP